MKALFVILAFLSLSPLKAQTSLIAHKSHSGSVDSYKPDDYTDNFGLAEPSYVVRKVKWVDERCVVEYYSTVYNDQIHHSDTTCNHPYFTGQYTMDQIKQFYPENTKFVGFEHKFYNDSIPNNPTKKMSIYWIFGFILILGFVGIYFKKNDAPVR